jgi:hypothetical protein
MALTYSNFTTFADVASWYERTKPLRGKDNTGKDIRPIGDRKRKFERIVKVSDNCYALSNGWHYGDDVFKAWYRNAEYTPTPKEMAFYAPIVWRKHKDGTETVTMRNGSGPGAHSMRYAFLYRHSPRGLHFRNRNGKHFIEVRGSGQSYFLAKGDTVPKPVWEVVQRDLAATKKSGGTIPRWRGWERAKNDNASLTFKRTDNGWELVDGGRPVPVPPKKRIDTTIKAKLKPHIDAFREWALTIGPMLPLRDYKYEQLLRTEMSEWAKETGYPFRGRWSLYSMFDAKLARKIIADPEHPLRMQLCYLALTQGELMRECTDEDDVKRVKAAFNRWVNKQLGLVKEVKE